MSDSFQPEKPYPPEGEEASEGPASIWIALLSALGVVMILAILAPRFMQESGVNWWVTLGAGVLVFVVVFLIGRIKGSKSGQPTWSGEDDREQ